VRLCIVGLRDYTGGSLGTQPARYGGGLSLYAVQFEPDRMLAYYIVFALWAVGLYIWWRVDRGMDRYALDAASQDEDAAASVGIDVTREKLKITAISAAMCAVGGAIYAQYQMYIGPDTIAGLGVSLNIVFAVIAGGMWVMLGPTVGAVFTQVLTEVLRVTIQSSAPLQKIFGSAVLALDTMIYGLLLILFIIYMPKGILGTILEWREKKRGRARQAQGGVVSEEAGSHLPLKGEVGAQRRVGVILNAAPSPILPLSWGGSQAEHAAATWLPTDACGPRRRASGAAGQFRRPLAAMEPAPITTP
jgi:branched-chain amino acid transport system permease protein